MDEAYIEWARSSRGVSVDERVVVRPVGTEEEGESGLFCRRVGGRHIETGATLIRVPFSSLLHVQSHLLAWTDGECRWVRLVAGTISRLKREDDMLALRMLYEARERGSKSDWFEHIRRMPEDGPPHSLLRWTDEELGLLRGTSLHWLAKKWKEQLAADFDELLKTTIDASDSHEAPPWLTLENYTWAISMIWSRSMTIQNPKSNYAGDFKVLAPLFDFANHGSRNANAHHGFEDDALYLRASADIAPGDEIRICYAIEPATRFLLLYGFVDESGFRLEDQTVNIFSPLDSRVAHYDAKLRVLEGAFSKQASGELPFKLSLADPLPEGLLASQRVARATEVHLDRLAEALPPTNRRLDDDNERQSVEGIREGVAVMRAAIPLDDDIDKGVLALEEASARTRYAALVRRAERAVLQASLDHINGLLAAFNHGASI